MAALGPDDRLAVGDDRVGELREEQRPVGDVAACALADVGPVVQPDADDLARPGNGRTGFECGIDRSVAPPTPSRRTS